ncbi:MAG: hypothetical protein A2428_03115 [Bdellovibrionales bacterium RIFOXYC1_FULL_54_43]|nr:MAG: hypothetical protein A2428_03115 [Bdellovibrionales bacterium RIFOXYC1_FULL_54_43]OFZ82671.1 MAG: hypothetical protein A2603_02550 [Bdellovibrionales bacterium RIFOXYD1_FULL_55_31]
MLSNPRIFYGVYSVTPYSRTTGEPYSTAKVVGEAAVALSGETNKLFGGASKFPYAIEDGPINSDISLKLKEYPDFLFELFLGKKPTTAAVDAAGAVTAITNVKGVSVVAATGIASATVKAASKTDLKFTKYIVKATDATHVDVYAMSDIDFARGTDKAFENDALKITAAPLAIAQGVPTEIPGFGLELTGGAGIIALVAGDTAVFEVKPPSTSSMSVRIGGAADLYPEFGLILMAQQRSNGEMCEMDIFRAKGIGLPISFAEKAYSEAEIKVQAFYDAAKSGVFDLRWIQTS